MGPGALAAIAAAIRLVFSLNTLNLYPLNILPLQNTQGTTFVNPFFSLFSVIAFQLHRSPRFRPRAGSAKRFARSVLDRLTRPVSTEAVTYTP